MSSPALAHAAWMPTNSHGGEIHFSGADSFPLSHSLSVVSADAPGPSKGVLIALALALAVGMAWSAKP